MAFVKIASQLWTATFWAGGEEAKVRMERGQLAKVVTAHQDQLGASPQEDTGRSSCKTESQIPYYEAR